jgi:hypothetical protein
MLETHQKKMGKLQIRVHLNDFKILLATLATPIDDPCNPSPCGPNAECRVKNGAGLKLFCLQTIFSLLTLKKFKVLVSVSTALRATRTLAAEKNVNATMTVL